MIALAVLGIVLAGAVADSTPADTSLRIPGTALRLGISDAAASARGFAVTTGGKRHGSARFFGLVSDAELEFEDGRLARATFTVGEVSPYEIAYVQDQLTAMGYHRRCAKLLPRDTRCDWSGPVAIHIEVQESRLTALASRPAPAPTGAEAPPGRTAGPPAGAAAPLPPPPPRAQAQVPAPRESTGATAALRTPTPRDSTAATAAPRTPAPRESTTTTAAPPPMLPETLTVALPGRPSPYAAAEVKREGHCPLPADVIRAGIQGRVWVIATVDTSGAVIGATISRGVRELNQAALCSARRWLFAPRTWQGRPCRYRVLLPVTLVLH